MISLLNRPVTVPPRAPVGTQLTAALGAAVQLGGRSILDGVDVAVNAGELVVLVGPNGAGKSTLLSVLTGDLPLEVGTVTVDGVPLDEWQPGDLARRRAVLPQQSVVSFPFTVAEVVRMGRAPWARTAAADLDDAAVADAIESADVAHLVDRQFPSLSGGERARVSLARVLAQCAQVLLLDEPTAALDLHHQEHVLSVVRDRVDAGDGAVVVLHDLGLAAAHADRIAILAGGRIVADGPPSEVLEPSLLSEVYSHEIEVLAHPRGGAPLIVPKRRHGSSSSSLPVTQQETTS